MLGVISRILVSAILAGFVKDDDQQPAALEHWGIDQRRHIVLQPRIRLLQREMISTSCKLLRDCIVMRVVVEVWSNERIVWKVIGLKISRELVERHDVRPL